MFFSSGGRGGEKEEEESAEKEADEELEEGEEGYFREEFELEIVILVSLMEAGFFFFGL